jgi:predicted RNA binding protein YcfA (HicA-like mRNA interferase family)
MIRVLCVSFGLVREVEQRGSHKQFTKSMACRSSLHKNLVA